MAEVSRKERLDRLGSRVKEPVKEPEKKPRTRHSLYLLTALVKEADIAYRKYNQGDTNITKSQFLEALLRYGLDNLEEATQLIEVEDES